MISGVVNGGIEWQLRLRSRSLDPDRHIFVSPGVCFLEANSEFFFANKICHTAE